MDHPPILCVFYVHKSCFGKKRKSESEYLICSVYSITMRLAFHLMLIKYYYIAITVLLIISPLKYELWRFIPALLFMWMGYLSFASGAKIKDVRLMRAPGRTSVISSLDKAFYCYVAFMLIFIPAYIKYYTGNSVQVLLSNFILNNGSESNYAQYQQYFLDNNLQAFSVRKLPYILGNGLAKVVFWFFCIYYVAYIKKIRKIHILLLSVLYLLFFLIGVSRGTSFENFELSVITVYSIILYRKMKYNSDVFSKKQRILIISLFFLAGFYFIFSKSLRMNANSISYLKGPTSTLLYNSDHWIMSLFPSVGEFALEFDGYFTFPLYYTSEVFWKIWMRDIDGFISSLVPFTANLLYDGKTYGTLLTINGVDLGACWNPDISNFQYYTGVPLYFYLLNRLGAFSRKCYIYGVVNRDIAYVMLLFVITYEMMSLPVGNFLATSSANQISVFAILCIAVFNRFKKFRCKI